MSSPVAVAVGDLSKHDRVMSLSRLDTLSPSLLFAIAMTSVAKGAGLLLATVLFWIAVTVVYLVLGRRALRDAEQTSAPYLAPLFKRSSAETDLSDADAYSILAPTDFLPHG